MLGFHRIFEAPSLGALRRADYALHSSFVIYAVETKGVVVDKQFFPASERSLSRARCCIQVVLDGNMLIESHNGTRELRPGDCSLQTSDFRHGSRECWSRDFRAVVVSWDPGLLGSDYAGDWSTCSLANLDIMRVRSAADQLRGTQIVYGSGAPTERAILDALAALQSSGLPLRCPSSSELSEESLSLLPDVSASISAALSQLHDRPRIVDLENRIGRSPRQIQRVIRQFIHRFGFAPGGFRETRDRWRLHLATTLMTAPDATTENVAQCIGYGSPQAFCFAMARAGLPSPGKIRSLVVAPHYLA